MTAPAEHEVTAHGVDDTTRQLAEYASRARYEDLPAEVVHAAVQRIVDTLGCALGAANEPPAKVARAIAGEYAGARGARVLGLAGRVAPDNAAFANIVMSRYLDFNDMNPAVVSMGHPSEVIPAILAVADAINASGRRALLGIVTAYQAFSAMPVRIKPRGWDQGMLVAFGVASGLGALLGLDQVRLQNAISLALTPNIALEVTRRGSLSMWKGCAGAAAARCAVFGTLLAAKGMTGPERPFEGEHGLMEQATGPFTLELDPAKHGYRITQSQIKAFPADGSSQPVLWQLLEMTRGLTRAEIDGITNIDVKTHWGLWYETGREPEKWDPQTRETADHSQPYLMAMVLRHGKVTPASFAEDVIRDPSLRPVMRKIHIAEDPELTRRRPPDSLSDIDITLASGQHVIARTGLPRGDHRNPMTDDEISQKVRSIAEGATKSAEVDQVLARLWKLPEESKVSDLMNAWADLVPPTKQ